MPNSKIWGRTAAAIAAMQKGDTESGVRMVVNESTAEIYIMDEISWFGVWAEELVMELNLLDVEEITVRINSPGGVVSDGMAIYNALMRHPAKIITSIEGQAASMASIIALAGDEVLMAKNAMFMIHNPWTVVAGDFRDLSQASEMLKQHSDVAAALYAERSGRPADDIQAEMDAETWFTAAQAHEAGFVTEVTDAGAPALGLAYAVSAYTNVPSELTAENENTESQTDDNGMLRQRMERRLRLALAS